MIHVGSVIYIEDNSGAKRIRCIRILSHKSGLGGSARLGEVVRGSVRRHTPHRKVNKGDLLRVLLVQVKKKRRRPDGSFVRYGQNMGVVLKGTSALPLGTRIRCRMSREFRRHPLRRWIRFRSIARGFA